LLVQRPTPYLQDEALEFMAPGDRVAQLYPRYRVPIFVAFYDMHGLQWAYSLIPATTREFKDKLYLLIVHFNRRVSSGGIVSDYGLDDCAIGVRSPAGAKDFSSILCVQTGSGVHPASCTMGTGGPFPGGKARPGRDADHSPPSSAEVVNE
jgi:hypothetical protein